MFCVAYHSPRLAKLKTAICVLPYLMVAPPSCGKFQVLPTLTHRAAHEVSGASKPLTSCAALRDKFVAGMNEPFQSAGRFWLRSVTNSMVGSVSSVLTNCLKILRFSGSLTTAFHSHS